MAVDEAAAPGPNFALSSARPTTQEPDEPGALDGAMFLDASFVPTQPASRSEAAKVGKGAVLYETSGFCGMMRDGLYPV